MSKDKLQDGRRRPFYIIDNDIIDKYGAQIGVYGIAVYNLIARYADANGENAFPSYSTITKKLGIGRHKAAETIQLLVDAGLVHRENRTDDAGDKATNLYTLVDLGGSSRGELPSSQPEPPSSEQKPQVVPHGNQGSSRGELYKDTSKKKQETPTVATQPQTPLAEQFHTLVAELKTTSNRADKLLQIYILLYGKDGAPNHGYILKTANKIGGAGYMATRLWELSARPPNGDIMAYLVAEHNGKQRRQNYENGKTTGSNDPAIWHKLQDQDVPEYMREIANDN